MPTTPLRCCISKWIAISERETSPSNETWYKPIEVYVTQRRPLLFNVAIGGTRESELIEMKKKCDDGDIVYQVEGGCSALSKGKEWRRSDMAAEVKEEKSSGKDEEIEEDAGIT